MSSPLITVCRLGARWCAHAVWSVLVWTLWLVLSLLLAAQIYIARTNELQVPFFVQRSLEQRLALSGVHVVFGHTQFDPSGRILAENVRLELPGFEESLVSARALYARLDLWALLAGRFEPVELRVTGVNLRVPAMLSPSGKADEIVRDLDGDFLLHGEEVTVASLHYHLGGLAVSMRGKVHLAARPTPAGTPLPVAEFLARNYAPLSREGAVVIGALTMLDRPMLFASLVPSRENGAWVEGTLRAERFMRGAPVPFEARNLLVRARLPLWSTQEEPFPVFVAAEALDLPQWGGSAHGVAAWISAQLKVDRFGLSLVGRMEAKALAADFSAAGLTLAHPLLRAEGGLPGPAAGPVHATLAGALWSEPVAMEAQLDLRRGAGQLQFRGGVSPAAVAFLSGRTKKDLHRWLELTGPVRLQATAEIDPGWKLARAHGVVAARNLTANRVHIDEVGGRVAFDGRRLVASEAYARLGADYARGTFEDELATRDYRFLLEGHLRPLDISPWIAGSWWKEFFSNMDFPVEPPLANMDLTGCWSSGRKALVFVAVDCVGPVFRGVTFDRTHARLFVRPYFDDALNVQAVRGPAAVRGTFTRRTNFETGAWQSLDLDLTSNLDLPSIQKIMGPAAPAALALVTSERPPAVTLRGHLDGPAAPGGAHQSLQIETDAAGRFAYDDFPLEGASFVAQVHDDDITLEHVRAGFAGGTVTGHARIVGRAKDRRLSFDATLRNASLGRAVGTVDTYTAQRAHKPPPAPGEFVKDKANVILDADLAAEGAFGDFMSFHGSGAASLKGAELGEVRMLGLLSALLRFTSLRFTTARAIVMLDGPRLVFPSLTVTGANSAIEARGTYGLDEHGLDFRATVNPFKESKSLPQRFMDVMLTPLSDVLAVRLTGTVEKPSWVFVNGPSNFLRSHSAAPPPSPLKSP